MFAYLHALSIAHVATDNQPTIITQGVSDSGATISIITSHAAQQHRLPLLQYEKPVRIKFGNGSQSTATHYAVGGGLIKRLAVVPDAALVLISTYDLTRQGYEVRYTTNGVNVFDTTTNSIAIQGVLNLRTKMWEFPLGELLTHPGKTATPSPPVKPPPNVPILGDESAYAALKSTSQRTSRDQRQPHGEPRKNLIEYIHTSVCSPPTSTFIKMVENNWIKNLPGNLTAEHIRANKPNSVATQMGHLTKLRAHNSKKLVANIVMPIPGYSVDQDDFFDDETLLHTVVDSQGYTHCVVEYPADKPLTPQDRPFDPEEFCLQACHTEEEDCLATTSDDSSDNDPQYDNELQWCGIVDTRFDTIIHKFHKPVSTTDANAIHNNIKDNTHYGDGTGPYPTTGSDGSKLAVVFMHRGYVHPETIKDTSAKELCDALERAINFFLDRKQTISRQVLDNAAPALVINLLKRRGIPFQLVPPDNHRYNRAERGVDIFKNRFIAMRAALDPEYPIATEWQRLLPRVEIAINISIPCATDPTISAWHGINGMAYDFSRFPLAPPGCKVLVHDSRSKRDSWDNHGTLGWCLEPSFRHYRAQRVFIPSTGAERITTSLHYFPHQGYVPGFSNLERLGAAIGEATETLNRIIAGKEATSATIASVSDTLKSMRDLYSYCKLTEIVPSEDTPLPLRPDPTPPQPMMLNLMDLSQNTYDDTGTVNNEEYHKKQVNRKEREELYTRQRAMDKAAAYDDSTIGLALHHVLAARKERGEDNPTITSILHDPALLAIWMPAIMTEIHGLIEVGALIPCTEDEAMAAGGELLPNIIQLKRKRNPDRSVNKLKARLCMNGSIELHQFKMFEEPLQNFSPNAHFNTILQLLTFSVRRGWSICGLDITMAYVMSPYTRSTPTFTYTELTPGVRQYYRLGRMIYGLPDAGRAWYETFKAFLIRHEYKLSEYDPCLFLKINSEDDGIAIAVTTDDCFISHSNNGAGIDHRQQLLASMTAENWKFTFDPIVRHMLGIDFDWLSDPIGGVTLRTPSKIMDLKEHFFASGDIVPKVFEPLMKSWTIDARANSPPMDATKYRKALGLVPYNTKCRNDTKFAHSTLAKYQQTPTDLDYAAIKHLAAYFWTTHDIGLCFHPASSVGGDTSTIINSSSDASWDAGHLDSKSSIATMHKIGDMATDPSAPHNATATFEPNGPSTSAMVSEAKGMNKSSATTIVSRGIAGELHRPQDLPTIAYQDNRGVVTRLKFMVPCKEDTKAHARMFNYLRHLVENGDIIPQWIESAKQPSDPMTKRTSPLENIRSLPMLQGHQPAIDELFQEYKNTIRENKTFTKSSTADNDKHTDTLAFAMVLSSFHSDIEYPRFPFDAFSNEDTSAILQEAEINAHKQESKICPLRSTRKDYLQYFDSLIETLPRPRLPPVIRWSRKNTYPAHPSPFKSIMKRK